MMVRSRRWASRIVWRWASACIIWARGWRLGPPSRWARPRWEPFLILGFTIHNITEGVGIAAPIVRKNPGLRHFAYLALVAGGPAIIGTWVGGFAFNPILATIFLAIGIGAILQVVWEVGKLVSKNSDHLTNWVNVAGVAAGIAVMYLTAFLVKF